ncbi:MAG: Ig-like domain-containing protein [Methylococcales bacterium]|nr:Ig-like domain-containing protein [Methylococcales bacterium]
MFSYTAAVDTDTYSSCCPVYYGTPTSTFFNVGIATISSVSSDKAAGTYKAGETINIIITFSDSVTVTGTPHITLETGTTDQVVDYSSGSTSDTLTFVYTVQAGDTAADLDYTATTALALNSGSIVDSNGNNATLTLPSVGGSDSLAGNEALVIDTTAPTMTITAAEVSDGGTSDDSTLSLTFTSSEATTNFVVGDISVSGRSLSSFSASSSTVYTATFTPSAADATTINVAGATFTDSPGNDNSAATEFNWTYSAPTISSTTVASDNSTIAVTFSEAVYNATGGSGALEASDFTLSISGGTATLSSATPSSICINGNVYTLGLSLSGTPDGDETITVVPSSSTAIYDDSNNAASTSQSNNTVTLNSEDSTAPTLSSSSPASGATGIALNANVVLTFSEAMSIGTGNVTITGNGSTETIAVGSAQVTGAGTTTITINPVNDFVAGINYSIVIPATAFDDAAGNSYAGTTITFLSFLPDPTNNQEVIKTIESQASIANNYLKRRLTRLRTVFVGYVNTRAIRTYRTKGLRLVLVMSGLTDWSMHAHRQPLTISTVCSY